VGTAACAGLALRDVIDKTFSVASPAVRCAALNVAFTTIRLSSAPISPDDRAIVDAMGRRDRLRILVDSMTAADDPSPADVSEPRIPASPDTKPHARGDRNAVGDS
jgi:hypothetical protein